jgi:hypothetical protein
VEGLVAVTASAALDAGVDERLDASVRAPPFRDHLPFDIASCSVVCAVVAMSATIREVAATIPRAPDMVAPIASVPTSAAPEAALTKTFLASCSAPTARASRPLTAPASTCGTLLDSIAAPSAPVIPPAPVRTLLRFGSRDARRVLRLAMCASPLFGVTEK